MGSDAPANIAGVFAFPNDEGGRMIRFIDSEYNTLFTVPNGANIILTDFDGGSRILPCQYIDDTHVRIGDHAFHICEFAEIQERNGAVYAPELPQENAAWGSYEIYQIRSDKNISYAFRPYSYAEDKLHFEDYKRVYAGVLAPKVTLDDLFFKHNQPNRPYGQRMHSLSVSDIIVTIRGGNRQAHYVDDIGFPEVKQFLKPRQQQKKKRSGPER